MALTEAQEKQKQRHIDYWTERETEAKKHYITDEAEYSKELQRIYDNMLDACQKEIDAFYGRYAKRENITLAEAKKAVSELDIKAYERKAKRYVKEKNFSKEANEEMRLYNLTMKINRLEMLKANIGLEVVSGHDELQKYMEGILKGRTMEELERQAGILGKTIKNNAQAANAIVNASFHNATFSNRIWQYHDLMKADLSKLLQSGLIAGKNPRVLAKELRKYFIGEPELKNGKNGAVYSMERLMRTELARVQTEAQKQSFERNGFTMYTFLALGDACDICADINGNHYKVADMMPGLNAPPMHPHCRCSTAAYEDDDEYKAWLEYLNEGGTTEEWDKLDEAGKQKWFNKAKGAKPLTYEEMKKQIEDDRKRVSDIDAENWELDRKISEYESKEKKFVEFDGLKKEEISSRLKVINDRIAELEKISDKWYNRPERGTDEYTAWREWRRSVDPDFMDELMRLSSEKADLDSKLTHWGDFEAWKKWKKENPIDSLRAKKTALAAELATLKAKIADSEKKIVGKRLVSSLQKHKVVYREVSKHKKALSHDEIVNALAGGDLTQGSCASVGLAYCGQKQGMNVLDFRDGSSRDYFSTRGVLRELSTMPGLKTHYKTARSSVTAGNQLLKQTEIGKEYYLVCGRHAAIVRRTDDALQYLELQSAYRSGWQDFDGNPRYTLKNRFGETKAFGSLDDEAFMIEVDSFKDCEDFQELLGYINTADDAQRKGRHGTIK